MSTAQGTASPRAPRGKQQHASGVNGQPSQPNNGRQGQRRPRGNRAHNVSNHHHTGGASPSRQPPNVDPAGESAVFASDEAQLPTGPRNSKHTQSQPSIDRVFSPPGAHASLTDNEGAPSHSAATPAKIQAAYAGPTFHASPAPSALPIPKFLSKSVPAKTRQGPPTPPPEDSSDSANSPSPSQDSPSRGSIPVPRRDDDSPLDLLFKADRAERAKQGNGSPSSSGFFSPPNPSRPPHDKHDSFGSFNAPFPIELDGQARSNHFSPPPAASPGNSRSVTDPNKVPQLKDGPGSPANNDVMQDLLSRLSQSQKRPLAATPPGQNGHAPSNPQTRHETPSPSFEGRSAVRSVSGPSTPAAANQEGPDFFYGNRNLSPLFKAAKNDTSKRNSGLRTEITADSPLVDQGMFQDFPASSHQIMDPNAFSRQTLGTSAPVPSGPRRGSVPYIQPHREMNNNNNRRRTPAKPAKQPRPESFPGKQHTGGPNPRSNRANASGAPASVKKPATSMMSFVPASVAAKQHSSSTPPSAPTPPLARTSPPPDTLALEQDLKRLLNLKMTGNIPGVR